MRLPLHVVNSTLTYELVLRGAKVNNYLLRAGAQKKEGKRNEGNLQVANSTLTYELVLRGARYMTTC